MGDTGERNKAGCGQSGLVDRRVRILLEEAEKPASGDPWVTVGIPAGDEHGQFERVRETESRQVFRGCHSLSTFRRFSARWKLA